MIITKEYLLGIVTTKGFRPKSLESAFGIKLKGANGNQLPKGWMDTLIGTEINDNYIKSLSFDKKSYTNQKKRTKKAKQKQRKQETFYESREWRELRYEALKLHGRQCLCCGQKAPNVQLHVDHIKPRSKYPELELDINNLQILCKDCNLGKSNYDCIDYRINVEN